jgi:hypothetical protein
VNIAPMIVLLAAVLDCTTDGPVTLREGVRLVRLSRRLGQQVLGRVQAMVRPRPAAPCPCMQERHERSRRVYLAFDPFRNSTEHEEYRPS